jgi:hypothetical protein
MKVRYRKQVINFIGLIVEAAVEWEKESEGAIKSKRIISPIDQLLLAFYNISNFTTSQLLMHRSILNCSYPSLHLHLDIAVENNINYNSVR